MPATRRPARRRALVLGAVVALLAGLTALPAQAGVTRAEAVFVADRNGDGLYGVYLRDLVTGGTTTVVAENGGFDYRDPALSPDGQMVAVSQYDVNADRADILLVASRGGVLNEIGRLDSVGQGVYDYAPRWAPDDSAVVWTRYDSTQNLVQLWISARGQHRVLRNDAEYGSFSPDGHQVVYTTHSTGVLRRTNTAGTSGAAITAGGTPLKGLYPTYSPDGTMVAYSAGVGSAAANRTLLHVADLGAGTDRTLTHSLRESTGVAQFPSWSADGSRITFDLVRFGAGGQPLPEDLYAIRPDDTGLRQLTVAGGDEYMATQHGPPVGPGGLTFTPLPTARAVAGRPVGSEVLYVVADAGVPSTASAVTMSVTATGTSAAGRVVGVGEPYLTDRTSPLSFVPGTATTGLLVPSVGVDEHGTPGNVRLYRSAAATLKVAITGYWSTPTPAQPGAGLTALSTAFRAAQVTVPGGTRTRVPLRNAFQGRPSPVPAAATAVTLRVTAQTQDGSTSTLAVVPSGGSGTNAVNLAFARGDSTTTVSGMSGGAVDVLTRGTAPVTLTVDVLSYLAPGRSTYTALGTGVRLVDSRVGLGTPRGAFAPGERRSIAIAGLTLTGALFPAVPSGSTAVLVAVTVPPTSAPVQLAVLRPAATYSGVPTHVGVPGRATTQVTTVPLSGGGGLSVLNDSTSSASADVIVDVLGYYTG